VLAPLFAVRSRGGLEDVVALDGDRAVPDRAFLLLEAWCAASGARVGALSASRLRLLETVKTMMARTSDRAAPMSGAAATMSGATREAMVRRRMARVVRR
jgi:hypothetical protein